MGKTPRKSQTSSAKPSLFDDWLTKHLQTPVSAVRAAPVMPLLIAATLFVEKNAQDQVNGANIQLEFGPEIKPEGDKPGAKELWVSREVRKAEDGTITCAPVNLTSACGLQSGRELKAFGSAVSLRFGRHGDGDDTYFAMNVPSSSALDKVFNDLATAINASKEFRDECVKNGILKDIPQRDEEQEATTVLELAASRIGYKPLLFCPIGQDGKLVINTGGRNWSSTRNNGTAQLYREAINPATGAIGVEKVPDRKNPNRQDTRTFRGSVFDRGRRSDAVAKSILAQLKNLPVWQAITAVSGQPFTERNAGTGSGSGRSNRFLNTAPEAMKSAGNSPIPAGATVEDPNEMKL